MFLFYTFVIASLILSFLFDRKKTIKALKIAYKKLTKILPAFLTMLISVSIVLYLVPDTTISKYLGSGSLYVEIIIACIIGSISLMPGFIAFPLAKVLIEAGIKYSVIASFTSSLMMVGILTFPVEKKYFGSKLTIYRNVLSVIIVIVLSIIMGLAYGEVTLW
ncbi:permease [Clostridiaceae bacterium M8S5]|nr:permease [Clostridiaceae bacterium M8S5]